MRALFLVILIGLLTTSQVAWGLCVKVDQANLRSRPDSKAKLLWTVGKYMPLLEVKSEKGWYLVKDLEGKKMWIYGALVSEDFDCAVVKASKSSLRKGPGTEFTRTPLSYAYRYMPFKKLEREGAWLHLQDAYGFDHWVIESNLWEPLHYTSVTY